MVKIENSDCQIWHETQVVADIIHTALTTTGKILLNLNYEGPCAESLGLFSLLDSICVQFNIDPERFIIETCNQLETHKTYDIKINPPIKGISELQDQLNKYPAEYKNINDRTKHFGNFVGHGNRIRLAIASHLYCYHKNKTLQSYHTNVKNAYFDQFIGLEELMFNDYSLQQVDMAFNFLKATPLKLDDIVSYPILHEKNVYDILDYYPNIFVDIVNQTYFTGNTFYVDDKFWRSVITKTPFMIQGPKNFIINLKRLGFRTFSQWWDEGYSEDPPDCQVGQILKNIDQLAQLDTVQLASMYDDMKSVLDHNYNVFLGLTHNSFKKEYQ